MGSKYSKITVDENLNDIIKSNPKLLYLLDDDKEKEYNIGLIKSRNINLLQKLILISNEYSIIFEYLIENIHLYKNEIDHQNEIGLTALMIVCNRFK